jgi:hypothetical protein
MLPTTKENYREIDGKLAWEKIRIKNLVETSSF